MAISVAVPVGERDRRPPARQARSSASTTCASGYSLDPKADYGPLVTEAALARVKDYIDQGVDAGARDRRRRP